MKKPDKTFLFVIAIAVLSAIAHENDVLRQCRNEWKADSALWMPSTTLKCEIVNR